MSVSKKGLLHHGPAKIYFRAFTGVYCIVLTVFISVWWKDTSGNPALYRITGLLSALLFSLTVILFLKHWISSWFSPSQEACHASDTGKVEFPTVVRLFLSFLAVDAMILLFVFFLQWKLQGQTSFKDSLSLWSYTDSYHYLNIARDWYLQEGPQDRLVELVFLPGYPLAVRAVATFVPDYLYAGMLVSAISFAGAGTILYCLARLDMDHRTAMRALRYTVLMPGVFFFAAPQSESLFFLLSISCIYLLRKRAWLPACLLGGLASFTRSLGILLLIPAVFEMVRADRSHVQSGKSRSQRILPFLMLFLILSGFGCYCMICNSISGDPLKWIIYQRENWDQQIGLFFSTAAQEVMYLVYTFQYQDYRQMVGVWIPNLMAAFGALGIMVFSIRKIRPSYGAYFLSYYAVAFGATTLISGPRYLLVLFPITFGIAQITRKRGVDCILTILAVFLSILYTLLFIYHSHIW